jgi:hypothetical protein
METSSLSLIRLLLEKGVNLQQNTTILNCDTDP